MAKSRRNVPSTGTWATCLASLSIRITGTDRVEHLWPGLVVNLDRELAPGFTIGQALAGRADVIEPATDPGEDAVDVGEPSRTVSLEAPLERPQQE